MEQTMFEKLGIPYVEKDGLLYPDIKMPVDRPIGSVGKYGLLWISYMKENYKSRYRHLFQLGRLNVTANDVNEEAYQMLDVVIEKYLQKHLPENPSSTMEMWKLREQAKMLAEESVLADIVYKSR